METEPYPSLEGAWARLAEIAWQAVLLAGVAALALGCVVLAWPEPTLAVVGVLFGLYLLVTGVVQLVGAFGTHASTAMRVLAFISGALSVLLGLLCFRGTTQSLFLLAIWIGIGWLFRGITQLMAAASDPGMPGRAWQAFLGAVTVVAGVVLIVAPFESIRVLTIVTGIWLIAVGIVEIATSFGIRSRAKHFAAAAREWQSESAAGRTTTGGDQSNP